MKTLDLARKHVTLEEVLKLAEAGSVHILTADGHAFVLEDADDFDKEVKLLGKSKKLQRFLKERSKEAAATSLEDYRRCPRLNAPSLAADASNPPCARAIGTDATPPARSQVAGPSGPPRRGPEALVAGWHRGRTLRQLAAALPDPLAKLSGSGPPRIARLVPSTIFLTIKMVLLYSVVRGRCSLHLQRPPHQGARTPRLRGKRCPSAGRRAFPTLLGGQTTSIDRLRSHPGQGFRGRDGESARGHRFRRFPPFFTFKMENGQPG